jgi:predicted acetyltransferase
MLKNNEQLTIQFYNEDDITDADDAELMTLLQLCFPDTPQFKTHRFYLEPSNFRWLIRDKDQIIANMVVYDKTIVSGGKKFRIAGIGDVCVEPDYRGNGLVGRLLSEVHAWAKNRGFAFTLLFGKIEIYQSSGYMPCANNFKLIDYKTNTEEIKPIENAQYLPLGDKPWPASLIDLQGMIF